MKEDQNLYTYNKITVLFFDNFPYTLAKIGVINDNF